MKLTSALGGDLNVLTQWHLMGECCGGAVLQDGRCRAYDALGPRDNALVLNTYMKFNVTIPHSKNING